MCGPHALGHLQPAFVDVGDDHVLGAHGAGGQQVDQPDGTGAADQDLLAERHARPPGHVTRGSMLTTAVVCWTLDTAPAGVDPDGEGLHEGALLQRHVVRQLVAEVRRVDVVPEQLQCTLAVQCNGPGHSVWRQNMREN